MKSGYERLEYIGKCPVCNRDTKHEAIIWDAAGNITDVMCLEHTNADFVKWNKKRKGTRKENE